MTKEHPKELVDAFVACKKNEWKDEATYLKFKEQSKAYLKGKADDTIEQGRLIVDLSRATMSLFRRKEDVEEEKPKKAKATAQLVSRPREISKLSGSDGEQAKEKGTQEVALESKG